MSHVYQGAVAPETYVLNLTPGASGIDLSTVSAASLKVLRKDGAEASWSASISNQTATTLRLTHTFAAADVDVAGEYVVYASMTVPAGTVRSIPLPLTVEGRYSTRYDP